MGGIANWVENSSCTHNKHLINHHLHLNLRAHVKHISHHYHLWKTLESLLRLWKVEGIHIFSFFVLFSFEPSFCVYHFVSVSYFHRLPADP